MLGLHVSCHPTIGQCVPRGWRARVEKPSMGYKFFHKRIEATPLGFHSLG